MKIPKCGKNPFDWIPDNRPDNEDDKENSARVIPSTFYHLVKGNRSSDVSDCLSKQTDLSPNGRYNYEYFIITAVKSGAYETVEVLLKYGAHVEMSEIDGQDAGYTPLMFAIRYRQAKMALLLLKHNANPRAKAADGKDSVQLLCQNYSLSMLDVWKAITRQHSDLVLQILSPSATNDYYTFGNAELRTPLHHLFFMDQMGDVTRAFMSFLFDETDFNLPDEIPYTANRSWTGVQYSLLLGGNNFNLTEAYLKKVKATRSKEDLSKIVNCELPCQNRGGHPLIQYCKRSNVDRSIVRPFLDNGYKINQTDFYGDNLLSACLQPGRISMQDLEYILRQGADVNVAVPNRRSIAQMAANVSEAALNLVLKFGAKPDPTEKNSPKLKRYFITVNTLKYLARRSILKSLVDSGGIVRFLETSELGSIASSLFEDDN
ncbi:hypothetical protein TCAL_11973 [Tigriopus californicus]|uniref:Uncharacterized protein n=1 Tax=Tigriopus californicus TaxID=6832 RepID=A0A553P3E4_TIGCA|nr:uncharacterized protein LOC131883674 [Tigriopus californicus]TRY72194.1 hypothetical protein TCAL_11973 [Tigriopus californicus]|eukprot:TCALIF_11973-PA protein Name:"Protein of unknown function" AED:0.00 eAED:0.00 QI:225/1/1/1/1/1/4/195/431